MRDAAGAFSSEWLIRSREEIPSGRIPRRDRDGIQGDCALDPCGIRQTGSLTLGSPDNANLTFR